MVAQLSGRDLSEVLTGLTFTTDRERVGDLYRRQASMRARFDGLFVADARKASTASEASSTLPVERAEMMPGEDTEEAREETSAPSGTVITLRASSTGRDWYGTEMSRAALESMAAQFRGGLPIIPRHNRGFSGGIEWDEVIATSVQALIQRAEVMEPFDSNEPQFVLDVDARMIPIPDVVQERDQTEQVAANLLKRLARGETIGSSIGGWFTMAEIYENDEGEVVRIVILDVELDHLAVTRAPANPDANRISMRSILTAGIGAMRAAEFDGYTVRGIEDVREVDAGYEFVLVDSERASVVVSAPKNASARRATAKRFSEAVKNDDEEQRAASDDEVVEAASEIEDSSDEERGTTTVRPTYERIEPTCSALRVREVGEALSVTLPKGASDEQIRDAVRRSLDGEHGEHLAHLVRAVRANLDDGAAPGDDPDVAPRSTDLNPAESGSDAAGVPTEEQSMPDTHEKLDAILSGQSALRTELDKIGARVTTLEGRDATPGADSTVVEKGADYWEQRARASEAALDRALDRPARRGRHDIHVSDDGEPVATRDVVIQRAKDDGHQLLARVAERSERMFDQQEDSGDKISRRKLLQLGAQVFDAAVRDGVIILPEDRVASW